MSDSQGSLFDHIYIGGWPKNSRFPTNAEAPRVAGIIGEDLRHSKSPLIITGFASLDRLIEWLAGCQSRLTSDPSAHSHIRVLIGHEPFPTARKDFRSRRVPFSQQVIDYWATEGVSLHLSAKILASLDLLRSDRVEVRTSSQTAVHAKIYAGDAGLSIGSSNFTASGLERQIEANVRFTSAEKERWNEAVGLAEEIWKTGLDFRDGLIELLKQLLQHVTWQEALARACAELLEGSWAERFREKAFPGQRFRLWPSQEKGIAHALWILEHQGSVLIADATGSGKTVMGAHLVQRIMARLARTGRGRNGSAVLMTPPAVLPEWGNCVSDCLAPVQMYSQGHLSQASSLILDQLRDAIRRTQVLVVDEAHNFLRRSQRTMTLFSNIADHVVLFTATPVSRGPQDMLAIIDLLGADNLDDDTLDVLTAMWKRRRRASDGISNEDTEKIRKAIRRFTVRRTKSDLNRMVDQEPAKYRLESGRICRYPRHDARSYHCEEPARDLELAAEIRREASQLKGLTRLRSIFELTDALRRDGLNEESYLAGRLRGAAALASHDVAAALRSSRVRLLEHVRGTNAVLARRADLAQAKVPVKGGVIETLNEIAAELPVSRLSISLPDWLVNPEARRGAYEAERAIYERIESLLEQLSETRENFKTRLLRELVGKHGLVLAFDSHLITLADLRVRLAGNESEFEVIVATGEAQGGRRQLFRSFQPGSDANNIVALCSDALAEGVNLQAASVVVMLDMPSVIRIAEQRIGRVDRMNSRHDTIEAYWPKDPPEFALRANERLAERLRFVRDHIGANLELPVSFEGDRQNRVVSYEDYVGELNAGTKDAESNNELQDAFASVRALVEGDSAIVPSSVYQRFRNSTARVLSSVSVVESSEAFAFVAIAGTEWGSPRWVYVSGSQASPITDLDEICVALRDHLAPDTKDRDLDDVATDALRELFKRLEQHEESLLPRGKQRALEEMRGILRRYRRQASQDFERYRVIDDLLRLASGKYDGEPVDLSALAEWWLETIQPVKVEHLLKRSRKRPVLLKDLRESLLQNPLDTQTLAQAFELSLVTRPIDERVVAAIIGVSAAPAAH